MDFKDLIVKDMYKGKKIVWINEDAEIFLVDDGNKFIIYGTRKIGYAEIILLKEFSKFSSNKHKVDTVQNCLFSRLQSPEYKTKSQVNILKSITKGLG